MRSWRVFDRRNPRIVSIIKIMCRPFLVTLTLSFAVLQLAIAQEYHQFTSKDGKQMSAMLLDISDDNRQAMIRREDGKEYEFEIVGLSLNDQQYIKNWLNTRVIEVKTDYRLEIDLDDTLDLKRHRRDSRYTFEQRFVSYKIAVRNLSRETLPAANLEYIIVWKEHVRVYESAEKGWACLHTGHPTNDTRVKLTGSEALGELAFNRDVNVPTSTVEINRALVDGKNYLEDDLVGIKIRIKDAHGNVLLEQDSAGSKIEQISWEDARALRDAVKDT